MPDQKENTDILNSNAPGSKEQDFSQLGNLKLNDLVQTPPVETSLIAQANAEEEKKAPKEEYKFENFGTKVQPTELKSERMSLGES